MKRWLCKLFGHRVRFVSRSWDMPAWACMRCGYKSRTNREIWDALLKGMPLDLVTPRPQDPTLPWNRKP